MAATEVPIPCRVIALMQERNRLFTYPIERLAIQIWSTRFRCTCCGECCTRRINDHIFLLDHDVTTVRTIDPAACEPAPDPEFCDQHGTLYVSGYALRMKDDPVHSCWFLENNRCSIYEHRFSGCRIYPHMLRRSPDAAGEIVWQQFSHSHDHGEYDPSLPLEDCLVLAREIKEYENAYFNQQIAFLETIHEYFTVHDLLHDPDLHRKNRRRLSAGKPVTVMAYHAGELYEHGIGINGDRDGRQRMS